MTDPAHHHFVLTEDLFPIMTNWAKDYGFIIPNQKWFSQNHKQLRVAIENALSRGTPDRQNHNIEWWQAGLLPEHHRLI